MNISEPDRLSLRLGVALLCMGPGAGVFAQQPVSPFSAMFFPEPGQMELSVEARALHSRLDTRSAVLAHEGDTVTGLLVPGLRWGWAPGWAVELTQPVAHRFQIDRYNPNVGPQGLRAPTLAVVRREMLTPGLAWRAAGTLQVNPWSSTGLNLWGGSLTLDMPTPSGAASTLGAAAAIRPDTDQHQLTLSATQGYPVGSGWLQFGAGLAHYSAYHTAAAHLQSSRGASVSLEFSRPLQPQWWAGVGWTAAHHRQNLHTVPTRILPLSLPVRNHTTVHTVTLSVRRIY